MSLFLREEYIIKVYIIILNYNNWEDTISCCESIFENDYNNYQIVIVDNNSSNNSTKKIIQWAEGNLLLRKNKKICSNKIRKIPFILYSKEEALQGGFYEKEKEILQLYHKSIKHPIIIIQLDKNLGYSGGNNIGLKFVYKRNDCDFIWILNNDTLIKKNTLLNLLNFAKKNKNAKVIGSKIVYYDFIEKIQTFGGGKIFKLIGNTTFIKKICKHTEIDYICGVSIFIDRIILEEVGFLDEKYFLYWEDVDWGIRMKKKGFDLYCCPESIVIHKEGATTGGITQLTDYFWVRNGLYCAKKFYPYFLCIIPFAYFFKYTLIRLIKKQPLNLRSYIKGIKDFLFNNF